MAYNQQAFGSFVVDVGINDVKARKSLQNFRRELSRLKSEMNHNIEYYRQLGDDAGLLKAKQDGLTERIKAQKDYIKQLNYTKKESIGNNKVENEEYNQLLITIQKAENSLRIFQQNEKKVAMQIASNAGEIKNLNRYHKEQMSLIDATSKRMEAQGKRYGALRLSAEKYTQSIRDSNKEVRLHKQGLRQLEEQGLKNTYLYRQQQTNLEKAVASRLNAQKAYSDFEKNKPVSYAKIRREQNGIPENAKRIESIHKGRTSEVEALRSTGDSDSYVEARASARVKRMSDLSKQIKAEENALTKKVSNTEYGGKIRETIGKLRKEYGELEDKQRQYGEGLDGLNRKNQKSIDIMKNEYQTLELTGQHFKAQLTEADSLKSQISLLNDQRVRENNELDAVGKKYGKQSDQYLDQSKKVTSLSKNMVNLNKRIKEIDKSTGGAYGAMSRFSDYVSQHQNAFDHIGNSLATTGKGMMAFGGGVGYAIAQGTKLNYKLEQTNNYTKALLQSAGEESNQAINENLEKAKKGNVKLSEDYGIAQDDIAQAQQELAHRGYQSNQMLQATKPLVEGSISTGYKLKDVTDTATGALEAFGLRSKNSKVMFDNTKKSINAMAYASDMSASSFNDTGTALSYVGPTAKTAGMSLEDTASAVGQLALSHIQGQKAGTGLRKMLDSLITPTAGGKEAMKELGVQVNDASGKMRPFKEIIADFHDKMQGLSQSKQVNLLHKIFGTTGQASASALINNSNALSKFNDQVDRADSNNYVSGLSKKKMDTPIEQIHRLKSAWQEMSMSLARDFAPSITDGIEKITNFLNKFNNASPNVKRLFRDFAIGVPVLGLVLAPLGSILRNIHSITKAWNGFSSLFSSKVKTDKQRADLLNDTLAEQNRLLSRRRDLIDGTGTISGIKDIESTESRGANYIDGRRGSSSVRTGESLAEDEKVAGRTLRTGGKLKGLGKLAKFGGSAFAGIDIASSLVDLVGTNSSNVGNHVGSAVGSLGGTAVGGLVGSLAGPLGTAVGSAVGSSLGEKLGGSTGQALQNSSSSSNDSSKKNTYHLGLKGTAKEESNGFTDVDFYTSQLEELQNHKPQSKDFKTEDAFNKAMESYNNQVQDVKNKIDEAYTHIEQSASDHIKKVTNMDNPNLQNALKDLGISAPDYQQNVEKYYGNKLSELQQNLDAMRKITDNGGSKDSKEYQDALHKVSEIESDGDTNGQKGILSELQNSNKKISDKQAGKYIDNSYKNYHDVTKKNGSADKQLERDNNNAQGTFDAEVGILNMYHSNGSMSDDEYNNRLRKAKEDLRNAKNDNKLAHDIVVDNAKDEYNKVIGYAQSKTRDHLTNMQEDTGNVVGEVEKQKEAIDSLVDAKADEKFKKDSDYKYLHHKKGDHIWNDIYNRVHNSNVTSRRNAYKEELKNKLSGNKFGDKDYASPDDDGKPQPLSKSDKEWLKKHNYKNVKGFAGGGAIDRTQNALVNERGTESAYDPINNRFRLFVGGPQLTQLHKGEHILNADDTYKLTHGGLGNGKTLNGYVNGTGDNISSNGYSGFSGNVNSNIDGVYDYTGDKLTKIKNNFDNTFKDIHDNTIDNTKNLVDDYAKVFGKLPSLTHDSIKGSINNLNDGFTSINDTLNQFGSHKKVLNPIHYATGSNGAVAKEHDAIVNDAKNGNEQEAIIRNDGIFLPKFKDALVHLDKGDAVLNGSQTRKFLNGTGLAHYKDGTGVSDKALERIIKNGFKHPSKQLDNDFKVDSNGSDLQKGLINDIRDSLSEPMNKWYGSIFNVLNHAKNDGVGLGDIKHSDLVKLTKKQLGKKRLEFVADKLNDFTKFTDAIPTKYHKQLLEHAGIPESDWADYNYIINHESGWNPRATNPNGGAYGLPQSLPANKMASAGSDWRTNPITQLRWQHNYIMDRYGSANNARAYWQANHNYENGGLITQEQIAKVGEHNKPEMILPLTDKFRTVQLAKQAVDFVNRDGQNKASSDTNVVELDKKVAKLNDNVSKLVELFSVVANNSGTPSKAYITDKEIFNSVMKTKHKQNIQSTLRRGEPIG